MRRLQTALLLSDKGYADLKKAILACTLTNLAMLLPFTVTVMIFREILAPFVNNGSIQWNHIWMLWGLGVISAIIVFLAAKNDYPQLQNETQPILFPADAVDTLFHNLPGGCIPAYKGLALCRSFSVA